MRLLLSTALALSLSTTAACSLTSKLGVPGKANGKSYKPTKSTPVGAAAGPRVSEKIEDAPDVAKGSDGDVMRERMIVFEPKHGHAKVEPMSAPWCEVAKKFDGDRVAGRLARTLGQGYWTTSAVADVGMLLCRFPSDPAYKQQTAYFIQGFMNATGLKKKDAIASLSARMNPDAWEKMHEETCARYPRDDNAIGFEESKIDAMRKLFGCNDSISWMSPPTNGYAKFAVHFDKRVEAPSEILRIYKLHVCYGDVRRREQLTRFDFRNYGMCHIDRTLMSRKALEAELKKDKHNTYAQSVARENFATARVLDSAARAGLDKAIAKDADYKKLFIDAPIRGWKAWKAAYKQNKSAFEAAYAMERALYGNSRKAIRKCGDKERNGLAAFVAKQTAGNFESAKRVLGNVTGRVLLGAVMACAAAHSQEAEYLALEALYKQGQRARGPRRAALMAMQETLGTIMADRRRFEVQPNDLSLSFDDPVGDAVSELPRKSSQQRALLEPLAGVVKSVSKEGDKVLVTFRTESSRESVHNCKDTNKIWRIDNGKVIYHRSCKIVGSKVVKRTTPPVIIPAYAKSGIKAGSYVEFIGQMPIVSKGKKAPGYPTAVFATSKKKRVVAAYGYAFK